MSTPPSSSLIEQLREATASRHRRIEEVLGDHNSWTLPHYKKVLRGFERFWSGWEPLLSRTLTLQGEHDLADWFKARSRWSMVRKDLEVLACSQLPTSANDIDWLPLQQSLTGRTAVLGSIYVMEGSNLGGQIIAKHVQQSFGLDAQHGAAYFKGWDSQTARMWQGFRSLLAQEEANGASGACAAAMATFDTLIESFQVLLHETIAT